MRLFMDQLPFAETRTQVRLNEPMHLRGGVKLDACSADNRAYAAAVLIEL